MADEPYATRREFDMLASRVDSIDNNGTRGVGGLQAQLSDAIKDITEVKLDVAAFKTETTKWFEQHIVQHNEDMKSRAEEREKDRRERTLERRWVLGFIVSILVAIGGMYEFLNVILSHIHS